MAMSGSSPNPLRSETDSLALPSELTLSVVNGFGSGLTKSVKPSLTGFQICLTIYIDNTSRISKED